MDIFDIQRRIREATDNKANEFLITRNPECGFECTLPTSTYEHDAEPVISEALGSTIEDFVKAIEEELGGKHLYKVGIVYMGVIRHVAVIYYRDNPGDDVIHKLFTRLLPGHEFDIDNSQAKDVIEAVLNR